MIRIFNFKADRLNGLDHLRAIAIILVMLFHYGIGIPVWLEPVAQIGWTGVDLFFVLSGYLIGFQLLNEHQKSGKINFRRFYLKRFFRIIPPYLAVLLVYYSLPNLREGSGLPPLWRFLTFTQNFGLDAQTQKSFSHAWSLCIEEQFYLLLPVVIVAVFSFKISRATPYLILFLIIIGFAFRMYNWNEYVQPFVDNGNRRQMFFAFVEKVYYPSYNRMDGLTIGVGIAAIFSFKPKVKEYLTLRGNAVLLFGLGLFFLAYKVCGNFISSDAMIYGLPLMSAAYGVIVIAAISPTCILYKIRSKFTFIIATLSYAIYLSHKQMFYWVKLALEEIGHENFIHWTFWICIIIAIIGGFILHLLIEKPFFRLRDKVLNTGTNRNFYYKT